MTEILRHSWGTRTYIMGVINVTPDSFSGDGVMGSAEEIEERAAELVADGADIIDIGGESTRPGFRPIELDEELSRVVPAIRAVARRLSVPISIDTSKSQVAERALAEGATIVNDVSGLRDPNMVRVTAAAGAGLVLVHNAATDTTNLLGDVIAGLRSQIDQARAAGVDSEAILVDPGLGMRKGWRENFEILRRLTELRALERPVLVGPSRKGMIGKVLGVGVHDRVEGTAALVVLSIAGGADVIRVHDVREMVRVARMTDALGRQQIA